MLVERCNELIGDASNDVRMLARLWQLQNKMGSVAASSAYGNSISYQWFALLAICLSYLAIDYFNYSYQVSMVMLINGTLHYQR
jgi:hypothetical protein